MRALVSLPLPKAMDPTKGAPPLWLLLVLIKVLTSKCHQHRNFEIKFLTREFRRMHSNHSRFNPAPQEHGGEKSVDVRPLGEPWEIHCIFSEIKPGKFHHPV